MKNLMYYKTALFGEALLELNLQL